MAAPIVPTRQHARQLRNGALNTQIFINPVYSELPGVTLTPTRRAGMEANVRIFSAVLLVLAGVGSAATVGVGVAHAAGDSDYLKLLSQEGFEFPTDETQQQMIKLGHAICNDLRSGAAAQKEEMVFRNGAVSNAIMSAAQVELCPDTI